METIENYEKESEKFAVEGADSNGIPLID